MHQRIGFQLEPYLQDTEYQQPWFMFVQQSSIYECIKFHNAYALHDHMNFGNHLKQAINHLLQVSIL
jgi:hypothetical protein